MVSGRRALFYVFDALIFAAVIFSAIFFIVPQAAPQSQLQHPAAFIAKDIITIIETMPLASVDPAWLALRADNITNLNNTVLEQIGEFWSQYEFTLANELIQESIGDTIPSHFGYGVYINDEELYATDNPPEIFQSSGWRVVSGYEEDKPVRGFIANARATKVRRNSTYIISFSPEGAGWWGGTVTITKQFNLSDITINAAEFIFSTHTDTDDNDIQVDINNGQCVFDRGDISWLYGNSDGNVGSRQVTACLTSGMNSIEMQLRHDGYNGHTHPGMHLRVNYTADSSLESPDIHVKRRFYLDDVEGDGSWGNVGVWQTFPFYIPETAKNISVAARISARNVRDYTGWNWFSSWSGSRRMRDYDYMFFLNNEFPIDSDNHPSNNPTYTYDSAFLGPYLQNGTNLLSVYLNTYGDYYWGWDGVRIYSDQEGDPGGSSYVEVNYTRSSTIPYGMIEVAQVEEFGGLPNRDKTKGFSYPVEADIISDAFVHIVQQFSYLVTVWADDFSPPVTEIFRSPSSRGVPTTVYMDPDHFSLSPLATNYVRVRDDNNGNDILPISKVEYRFYIPSFVGFGDVFATEQAAIDDAEQRLADAVGTYLSADDIASETSSIQDVPTLWGPAVVEVRVWN